MITRRKFNTAAASAVLSLPLVEALAVEKSRVAAARPTPIFDKDADFTPYGYIDNPYHSWNMHPSGVFRSMPGVGFSLYYPAGPGGYFDFKRNGIYRASLRLGFLLGGRELWAPEDFRHEELRAVHHSKDVFTYRVHTEQCALHCTFFQNGEDSLVAHVACGESGPPTEPVRLILVHEYELGGARWWGGDGVSATYDSVADAWVTHGFAAGTVFVVAAESKSEAHTAEVGVEPNARLQRTKQADTATAYETQPIRVTLTYPLSPQQMQQGITMHMCRGANRKAALRELQRSKNSAPGELRSKQAGDAEFWNESPRLTGNWPKHWKNGWVYDFETLRMMVRRPIGIYRHPWDGMQIQAPRSVLAETSIDMWALSYVDPAAAKAVFVGQFLDAIEPNVPCAREDGTTNMVATDGSECGTSISWCYPFFCAESIFQRDGDREWLERLYPKLAQLLRWTLENRTDGGKFIIAKCSWESGMDGSRRFLIDEPTGGETTEFARLVELQAATAQAGAILTRFATELGKSAEAKSWREVRDAYEQRTQQMWNGRDWYNDFDTRSMKPITSVGRDVGQVAPIFCDIASGEQTAKMAGTLGDFYRKSLAGEIDMGQDPLQWSSLLLPYAESLRTARQFTLLAQVVHTVAERIYASMDRRSVAAEASREHHVGWPGVSCEVWGPEGAKGGEGYGWGAVMPTHIIRNLLGMRETADPGELLLAPNLPAELLKNGEVGIENLAFRRGRLSLSYSPASDGRIKVAGSCSTGTIYVEDTEGGSRTAASAASTFTFEAEPGHVYRLHWRHAVGRS